MSSSEADANPSDANVEKSIRKERNSKDRYKNSIVPEFLEDDGIAPKKEESRNMKSQAQVMLDEDYEDLSSDKEEDTTEGEITDTHTSE